MKAHTVLLSGVAACVLGAGGCAVDTRPLTYEYHELAAGGLAGTAAAAGRADAGSSSASDAGASGEADSAGSHSGGKSGSANSAGGADGGSPTSDTGGTSANAGTSSGGASAGSSGEAGGSSNSGGTGTAGSLGTAGGPPEFPCGDLNLDAVDDCTQTLVQNSRFDSADTGWDAEDDMTQAWDSSNATSKAGSGSLRLNNTRAAVAQTTGAVMLGSHQCIPAVPGVTYDVAARVMLAAGQTGGQAGVNIWLFDDGACQGNLVTGATPVSGGEVGKWQAVRGTVWVPSAAHSMYIRLVAIKPFTQSSLSVLVDDVLVAKR
ncbi:MAG TPA: hypothetical protein VER96_31115 [Polyangiaceae bacterium]|nr:hypothetical protein [Polyangiaceae bacterium]